MLYRALPEFDLLEPTSLREAGEVLASSSSAAVMAGGISLLDDMKRGMAQPPTTIITLKRVPGLRYLEGNKAQGLRIGPLATIRDAEFSQTVKNDFPLLHEALSNIHSVQVKTMGTIVGNVCVGTPASDILTALVALDATVKLVDGPGGSHPQGGAGEVIPAASLCQAPKRTRLSPSDVVKEIEIPALPDECYGAYLNLARTLPDISKLMVAVNVSMHGGICREARIAIGAAAPVIYRARAAEDALKDRTLDAESIAAAAAAAYDDPMTKPITDIRSTAEYRKEMVRVLVRRALEAVAAKAAKA